MLLYLWFLGFYSSQVGVLSIGLDLIQSYRGTGLEVHRKKSPCKCMLRICSNTALAKSVCLCEPSTGARSLSGQDSYALLNSIIFAAQYMNPQSRADPGCTPATTVRVVACVYSRETKYNVCSFIRHCHLGM